MESCRSRQAASTPASSTTLAWRDGAYHVTACAAVRAPHVLPTGLVGSLRFGPAQPIASARATDARATRRPPARRAASAWAAQVSSATTQPMTSATTRTRLALALPTSPCPRPPRSHPCRPAGYTRARCSRTQQFDGACRVPTTASRSCAEQLDLMEHAHAGCAPRARCAGGPPSPSPQLGLEREGPARDGRYHQRR